MAQIFPHFAEEAETSDSPRVNQLVSEQRLGWHLGLLETLVLCLPTHVHSK